MDLISVVPHASDVTSCMDLISVVPHASEVCMYGPVPHASEVCMHRPHLSCSPCIRGVHVWASSQLFPIHSTCARTGLVSVVSPSKVCTLTQYFIVPSLLRLVLLFKGEGVVLYTFNHNLSASPWRNSLVTRVLASGQSEPLMSHD